MKERPQGLGNIAKATLDTRYTETRKVLDGSIFSESDIGLLRLLKDSLTDSKQREILLDVLEARSKPPVPLSEIINVLEKFSNLEKIELTEKDLELLSFTVKYFENWFYSGEWTKVSQKQNKNPDAYAYFSVPAGIVNLITKFKDSSESSDKIVGFDRTRLANLQKDVEDFATQFLSKERLESILKENLNPEKREKIEYLYNNRESIMNAFLLSKKSVEKELSGGQGSSGSKAPDLYLLKTCLIGAEMIRREHAKDPKYYVFTPQKEIMSGKENYVWFDFSQGKNRHSSMHYHKERLLYAQFMVQCLENRK
jgi:hypothetical protein